MRDREYIGPREQRILAEQAKVPPEYFERERLTWFGIRITALVEDSRERKARIELINLLKFRIN